jgi:hypothetical protein
MLSQWCPAPGIGPGLIAAALVFTGIVLGIVLDMVFMISWAQGPPGPPERPA